MWTPAEVLPFLEHPDPLVREHAASYFNKITDAGRVTVSDALRAFDRYPDDQFGGSLRLTHDVPATQTCVAELLRRLAELRGQQGEETLNHRWALLRPLRRLSYPVLNATSEAILASPDVAEDLRKHLALRMALQQKSAAELWSEFSTWVEREEKAYAQEVARENGEDQANADAGSGDDVEKAGNMIEPYLPALALHPDFVVPRVMEILQDKAIQDYREIHAVELAGLLKLEAAIPLLIERFLIDTDLLREKVNDALGAIGTVDVARRLREFIPGKEWDVRLYADDALTRIKRPECEQALLELLTLERATDLRTGLAYGLTMQISAEGFAQVEHLVVQSLFDGTIVDLDEALYAVSIMLNRPLANAAKIRRRADAREARRRERRGIWGGMGALGSLPEKKVYQEEQQRAVNPAELSAYDAAPTPFVRESPKVGRNDPCPCGSGKKYKKCCGK